MLQAVMLRIICVKRKTPMNRGSDLSELSTVKRKARERNA